MATSRPIACFGLLNRKERWGLSIKGWLLAFFSILLAGVGIFFAAYPFLSVSHPIPAEVLVVEGWISSLGAPQAAEHIRKNGYKQVFVTGGPIDEVVGLDPIYGTYANRGLLRLKNAGVPDSLLQSVPSTVRDRNRTYSSALALKKWFNDHDLHPIAINVFSEAAHARRSRLLFQKALAPEIKVGIIALPPDDFPPARWWSYSSGVKEVISEGAAYVYARFFFWP